MPPSSVKLSIGGGTVRLRRNVGQVVNLRPIVNRPARDKKGCLVAPMPLRGWQSCRTILRGAQRNDDLVVQALTQCHLVFCTSYNPLILLLPCRGVRTRACSIHTLVNAFWRFHQASSLSRQQHPNINTTECSTCIPRR